nr:hypothetical protein [Acidisphaera sp. L21]
MSIASLGNLPALALQNGAKAMACIRVVINDEDSTFGRAEALHHRFQLVPLDRFQHIIRRTQSIRQGGFVDETGHYHWNRGKVRVGLQGC